MHFAPPEDDSASAEAAADAATLYLQGVDNFLSNAQLAHVNNEVLVIDESSGQTTGVFTTSQPNITGADTANALPNACMILQQWRTGVFFDGREIRGRTFIPGCTETSSDAAGNLSTAAAAGINTAASALLSSTQFGIYSPLRGVFTEASLSSVWTEFAILRSRRD